MEVVKNALSNDFLAEFVRSSIINMENKKFFSTHDTDFVMTYCNFGFLMKHKETFGEILVKALRKRFPNCSVDDFVYINDFTANVNIPGIERREKDSIYTSSNKLGWHRDGTDSYIGPCYNLWIPLFSSEFQYDNKSYLEYVNPESEMNAHPSNILFEHEFFVRNEVAAKNMQFLGLPQPSSDVFYYWNNQEPKWACEKTSEIDAAKKSVFRSILGDAYVFDSSIYHKSGSSMTPRIALSAKFLYKPLLKVHRFPPRQPFPSSWISLLLSCYLTNGNIECSHDLIPEMIESAAKITKNQTHVVHIAKFLKKVLQDIERSSQSSG
jgi:hypothetical protein